MDAPLQGMRLTGIGLGAFLALWPIAAIGAGERSTGFVEVQVEPAAPVVVVSPFADETALRRDSTVAAVPSDAAPTADGLAPPDLPQVVVAVPPADVPLVAPEAAPIVPAPVQAAEAPAAPKDEVPVAPAIETTSASKVDAAAAALTAAIQLKLADASLPLPPKFAAREREGLADAYASGEHRPLWIKDGTWSPAGEALIDRLSRADEDGLDPNDYAAPRLTADSTDASELAHAELKLSAAAYLYARDARGGRLEPNRLGGLITPKLDLPGVERVLATLAASDDAGAALQGFNPRYPGYAALREKLRQIREQRPAASAKHPRAGTVLASAGATTGSLSRWTPRLEGDLLANMERWRWLPAHVGTRYIQVNIPEYRLRLIERGEVLHEARVITGAVATPTPIFSDLMDHAIVNPSWFVPPSILKKMNVESAAKNGYHVTQRRGVTSVRMPPGPRNALGYIKFMFPNDHAVYLHDTPNRGLFGGANRALSHGCVRVQDPFALAGKILGPAFSESRLKGMIGHGERMIKLEERLPIHLSYFTLSVDEDGELKSFGDIYGYHGRVRRALGFGA